MTEYRLASLEAEQWTQVAQLICDGTNRWYREHGLADIFASPDDALFFPQVYEALDPGCCLVAVDAHSGELAASCFYHPRETHLSLGIMNVAADCWGQGLAGELLRQVIGEAERRQLPLRLVSSALNLDSYSLYTRAGFVPQQLFQDMILPEFTADQWPEGLPRNAIRPATEDDLEAIVALDRELTGLQRRPDFAYFLSQPESLWQVLLWHSPAGRLDGVMAAVNHPGCRMIGPGFCRRPDVSLALLLAQRLRFEEPSPVFLVPATARELIGQLYALGARNVELHVAQVRGDMDPPAGLVHPTFLPESG